MSRRTVYKFRLYVAGDTLNSLQAAANLKALCHTHLAGRHEIEVVDVFRDPERALEEEVRMTPTLIKLAPLPVKRIIGSLSHTTRVLETLGLGPSAT